jgi:hypothetical protein
VGSYASTFQFHCRVINQYKIRGSQRFTNPLSFLVESISNPIFDFSPARILLVQNPLKNIPHVKCLPCA